VLAVIVLVALAVGSSTAGAITVGSRTGSPGSAGFYRAVLDEVASGDRYIGAGAGTFYQSPRYPNRAQWVCAQTRFWRLNINNGGPDSWARVGQATRCGWISASGTYVNLGGVNYWNPTYSLGYSVDVVVRWKLSRNAPIRIGRAVYDFRARSDYECLVGECVIDYNHSVDGAYIANWSIF
jgi:hypothetical protein